MHASSFVIDTSIAIHLLFRPDFAVEHAGWQYDLPKARRGGVQAYAIPPRLRESETSGADRIRTLLRDMPVEMRAAGTLLILKTLPGSAHPLAAALDRARWPEVVGSIAGDDTVFVAFGDRASLARVRRRLEEMGELPG